MNPDTTPSHALVTRPRPELDALAASLADRGILPVRMPAFRFEPTGHAVTADEAWGRGEIGLLIFTSPRSVEFGLPAVEPSLLPGATLVAIGPATARSLEAAGHEPLLPPGPRFDSEGLLAMLAERFSPGAAVILTAPGGREALQRGLEAAGWTVRSVPVYERVVLEPDRAEVEALIAATGVVSFWTSGSALEHVLGSLPVPALERILSGRAIVVSERLRSLARESGFRAITLARGAANADLLDAL